MLLRRRPWGRCAASWITSDVVSVRDAGEAVHPQSIFPVSPRGYDPPEVRVFWIRQPVIQWELQARLTGTTSAHAGRGLSVSGVLGMGVPHSGQVPLVLPVRE